MSASTKPKGKTSCCCNSFASFFYFTCCYLLYSIFMLYIYNYIKEKQVVVFVCIFFLLHLLLFTPSTFWLLPPSLPPSLLPPFLLHRPGIGVASSCLRAGRKEGGREGGKGREGGRGGILIGQGLAWHQAA